MTTLNEAWRSMLSGSNERTICATMLQNVKVVAEFAHKYALIEASGSYQENLSTAVHDITQFVNLLNDREAFQTSRGNERLDLRRLSFHIANHKNYTENSPKSNDRLAVSRIARELPSLSNSFKAQRNTQSHNNSQVNDPAAALQLAAQILRLFEISLANSLNENQQKLKQEAIDATTLVATYLTQDSSGEAAGDLELGDPTTPNNKPTAPEVDGKLERLEKDVDSIRASLQGIESKIDSVASAVRTMHTTLNATSGDLQVAEPGTLYLYSDGGKPLPKTGSASEEIHSDPQELLPGQSDSDAAELQLEQELERILTPSQARFELLELRNEIRHSYVKSGRNLEHWENILQGPIVDQMLSERPSDVTEWKKLPAVAVKYSQFTKLMDEQLSAFSEQMFEILSRITSINFFEEFDKDIPF